MSSPYNSDMIEELLTYFLGRDGWRDWSPTVDQDGAVGITVVSARYVVLANTVHMLVDIDVTGTGTTAFPIIIQGIPSVIAPAHTGSSVVVGSGLIFDTTGSTGHQGSLIAVGANDFRMLTDGNNNYVGATPAFPLGNGDTINFHATYERA